MIFASDLDRTLIYSNKFLDTYADDIEIIEEKDNIAISHMSQRTICLLSIINEKILFIPTTTRSLEQYKRITIFQNKILPKYTIVANGGIILKNNIVDNSWQQVIEKKMKSILSPQTFIERNKVFFNKNEIKLYKACDDLFVYAVFYNKLENNDLYADIEASAVASGYKVTPNGRKLYFIPSFMTKWEAVSHIMQLENEDCLIAAGDSILDAPMLVHSKHGFIPLHGDLSDHTKTELFKHKSLHFTKSTGIDSSDELLESILQLIG
jgi:hydroxymethylpyrimidine pyrophosphatase-like HAD family hydrolase